jgi:hypothetical protein
LPRNSRRGVALVVAALLEYLAARRALVPFVTTVGYAVTVAVRAERGGSPRPWLVGLVALACALLRALRPSSRDIPVILGRRMLRIWRSSRS